MLKQVSDTFMVEMTIDLSLLVKRYWSIDSLLVEPGI